MSRARLFLLYCTSEVCVYLVSCWPKLHAAVGFILSPPLHSYNQACPRGQVTLYERDTDVQQHCVGTTDLSHTHTTGCVDLFPQHLHKRRLEESHELRRKKRQSEGKMVPPPRKLQVSGCPSLTLDV